jgi:hypothetical protein
MSAWSDRSYAWRRTLALASARPGGFLLGIVLHRLFCVRTTIDRLLFPAKRVRFSI